jgi:hypothetical protein
MTTTQGPVTPQNAQQLAAQQLAALLRAVQQARVDFRSARNTGRAELTRAAQLQVVGCLSRYTEALDVLCLPVPYLLRDELRIYSQALRS